MGVLRDAESFRADVYLRRAVHTGPNERVHVLQDVLVRMGDGWIAIEKKGDGQRRPLIYIPVDLVDSVVTVG